MINAKKEFEVKQEIEKVKGDIRRVYFICPYCGEKYIAYYLSNKIEHKQEKIKKLALKLNKYFKGAEKGEKYLAEYEDLRKGIKLDMQELKERFKED
ncbi:hypothetical protein [Clostridium perfringens]|uniref:hypothetical protein n=1 Tax=Clostridium perfringens TaxID=1502 RepID=UPI003CF9AE06